MRVHLFRSDSNVAGLTNKDVTLVIPNKIVFVEQLRTWGEQVVRIRDIMRKTYKMTNL